MNSKLPDFRKLTVSERLHEIAKIAGLNEQQQQLLQKDGALNGDLANGMIENVIGKFELPFGIATNFKINGKDHLIPMVVEEPSIVAAASYMAKLVRENGGFTTSSTEPLMRAQVQILGIESAEKVKEILLAHKDDIIQLANSKDKFLIGLGGGCKDIEVHLFESSKVGPMAVMHLIVNVCDAMGANTVNTMAETVTPLVEKLTGGQVRLRILSNLADLRLVRAELTVRPDQLEQATLSGHEVIDRMLEAYEFAVIDPYRAATHNKGIMNGIDPVIVATGNDWRGSHARTRYLESVNAVIAAKQQGGFHIGVALNPFKYSQAEKQAQYLKLHKKLQAGADYIITQLGFDLVALKQAHEFLIEENYTQKILACVMPLTLARAKFMLKHNVAGIVITPHMLDVLAQEHDSDQTENTYLRCALQILICQHIGYAGVHLSACHKADEQAILTGYIEQYRHLDLKQCQQLWDQLWQLKTGNELRPAVVEKSKLSNLHQKVKYQFLDTIHNTMFNSSLVKGLGAYIFSAGFWNKALAAKLLLQAEYLSKHFIVGCESCGQCRLAETLYICPETCPKGLANGPCGGTHLDRCEFGDRECIHSVKARLAEEVDQIQVLKKQLIPTVPIEVRGTSSWKNWYVKQ